jgi:tripartite-type tricarboxylate transporter receptor subunit TctC
VQAVGAGDVQLTFGTPPSIIPIAQTGKVKMIAVTSAERSPDFPNLPTIEEAGVKGYDYSFWFGLFGPAGLPAAVVDKLAAASAKVLSEPELKARLSAGGNAAAPSKNAAEFTAWAASEGQRLRRLMEQSGARVD